MSDILSPEPTEGAPLDAEAQTLTDGLGEVVSEGATGGREGSAGDAESGKEPGEAVPSDATAGGATAGEVAAGEATAGEVAAGEAGAGEATAGGRSARLRQLEREGEVAADFLETLLDIADLDGDLDVDVDGDRAAVAIVDSEEGRVPRRLVGPDGKVLDALQELTRLAVQAETGERSRLMLDIAGYRAERRKTLVDLAKQAVTEVKETGAKRSLEPMSAFERKVVHDVVADAGLVSESEGVEPRRFIVIHPG